MPDRDAMTVSEYQQWVASQGGKARKKSLSKTQRREIARKAARARWAKKRA
jgi:hypothetical protein